MADINNKFEEKLLKINSYLSSFISDKPPKQISKEKHPKASKTHPANRTDFDKRLATFEYGTWIIPEVSPLQFAQRGWTYYGINMLHCSTCEAFLCTSLPSPCDHEMYNHALNILKMKMQEQHKMWCGWKDNCSPIEFTMPPLSFSVHYLTELRQDAAGIVSLRNNLPYFSQKNMLNKLGLEEQEIKIILKDDSNIDEHKLTSCILALCGWKTTKSNQLQCNMCLRSVGLWNFYSIQEKDMYDAVEKDILISLEKKEIREIKRKEKVKAFRAEKANILAIQQKHIEAELELGEERLLQGVDSQGSSDMDEEELMQQPEKVQSSETTNIAVCKVEIANDRSIKNEELVPNLILDVTETISKIKQDDDLWSTALGYNADSEENENSCNEDDFQTEEIQLEYTETLTDGNYVIKSELPTTTDLEENCSQNGVSSIDNTNNTMKPDNMTISLSAILEEAMSAEVSRETGNCNNSSKSVMNKRKISTSGDLTDNANKRVCLQEEDNCNSSSDSEEQEEEIVEHLKYLFDPIDEHRFWCGWVADIECSFNSSMKGFMVIPPQLKTFQNEMNNEDLINSEKYAKNIEGLRAVRTILETSIQEE